MASPATLLTAANERIHFTKHSSGSAHNLLQSHSQHQCRTSIVALEDARQYLLGAKRSATKLAFTRLSEESLHPRQSLCTADSLIV
jgi:hypothetical protein